MRLCASLLLFLLSTVGSDAYSKSRSFQIEVFPTDAGVAIAGYSHDRIALSAFAGKTVAVLSSSDSAATADLPPETLAALGAAGISFDDLGNGLFAIRCLLACEIGARDVGRGAIYVTIEPRRASRAITWLALPGAYGSGCCWLASPGGGSEELDLPPVLGDFGGGNPDLFRVGNPLRSADLRAWNASAGWGVKGNGCDPEGLSAEANQDCVPALSAGRYVAEQIAMGDNKDRAIATLLDLPPDEAKRARDRIAVLLPEKNLYFADVIRKMSGSAEPSANSPYQDPLLPLLMPKTQRPIPYDPVLRDYLDLLIYERRRDPFAQRLLSSYMREVIEYGDTDFITGIIATGYGQSRRGAPVNDAFMYNVIRYATLADFLRLVFESEPLTYSARIRELAAERLREAGFLPQANVWAHGSDDLQGVSDLTR